MKSNNAESEIQIKNINGVMQDLTGNIDTATIRYALEVSGRT